METFEFQAEINQLMSLIINTFYTNKDIFLRELISNASDAIDKIRYQSLTNADVLSDNPELAVFIKADKEAKTITIEDTGVGMTKDELIKNLGCIAHSGTKAFMEAMSSGKTDVSCIGQFGVGFYSAYLVADRVVVTTKQYGDSQYTWESSANGSFTITKDECTIKRGTRIVIHMKEDMGDYLEEQKLTSLIKTHSEFIGYPINLFVTRTVTVPVPPVANETNENTDQDDGVVEDDQEAEEPIAPLVQEQYEIINKQKPIWMRTPEDVTPEEYESFYKVLSSDWNSHIAVKHFSMDGQLQYRAILYVPKTAPHDLFDKKECKSIKLYVKRVFITDESKDMIPEYLSFIRGVIDSDDLPLNVSREFLQQTKIMNVLKKNVVKKCLEMFKDLADNKPEDYKTFYSAFSKNIKLGVHDDSTNRSKLVDLLRYTTSKKEDSSFKDYVARMPDDQKNIYYMTGESVSVLEKSPFVEKLKKKGYEVIYMVDAIDEYLIMEVKEYDSKKLMSITRNNELFESSDEEKKSWDEVVKHNEVFCTKLKEILGDKVVSVKVSNRIVDSPCVLVTDEYGWSANMERIMKAQALKDTTYMSYLVPKKIMEINPDNKIIQNLKKRVVDMKDSDKSVVENLVRLLYNTAIISSGFTLEDPALFSKQIYNIMNMGLDGDVESEVIEEEEEEEVEETNVTAMEDLD